MDSEFALIGGSIYTPGRLIPNGTIICRDSNIKAIGTTGEMTSSLPSKRINLQGMIISPGFIDIHLHGAMGHDFLDASGEDIYTILSFHAKHGTTTLLPTLMCASLDKTKESLERITNWMLQSEKGNNSVLDRAVQSHRIETLIPSGAIPERYDNGQNNEPNGGKPIQSCQIKDLIYGFHLEGPFINIKQCGVQNNKAVSQPDDLVLAEIIEAAKGNLKILTLAPELSGADSLIKICNRYSILPSAGHTLANFEEMNKGIELGIRHVCHLYNAMRPFHHRDPGIIGAILNSESLTVELIMDAIHVHPAVAAMSMKILGKGKIALITDCSPLIGLNDGTYRKIYNGSRQVWTIGQNASIESTARKERGDKGASKNQTTYSIPTDHSADNTDQYMNRTGENLKEPDENIMTISMGAVRDGKGRLAGSMITIHEAIKNCVRLGLATLPEAISMATLNPARILGIERLTGQLKPGFKADIIAMDHNLIPRLVIKNGRIIYS